MTVLINDPFYHGIFPDELKLASVVPIFKPGQKLIIIDQFQFFLFSKYMND